MSAMRSSESSSRYDKSFRSALRKSSSAARLHERRNVRFNAKCAQMPLRTSAGRTFGGRATKQFIYLCLCLCRREQSTHRASPGAAMLIRSASQRSSRQRSRRTLSTLWRIVNLSKWNLSTSSPSMTLTCKEGGDGSSPGKRRFCDFCQSGTTKKATGFVSCSSHAALCCLRQRTPSGCESTCKSLCHKHRSDGNHTCALGEEAPSRVEQRAHLGVRNHQSGHDAC